MITPDPRMGSLRSYNFFHWLFILALIFASTAMSFAAELTNGLGPTSCNPELVNDTEGALFEGQVEFIWYPKSARFSTSHVELAVDGKMWNPIFGYSVSRTMERALSAARSGRRGFFRFRLQVSPEELVRLRSFLDERKDDFALQTCVTGSCKALEVAGIQIPKFFTMDPLHSVAYLLLAKIRGNPRVQAIEYVGSSRLRSLFAPQIAVELLLIAAATQLSSADLIHFAQFVGEFTQSLLVIR